MRYAYRPFDVRWVYWELEGKLLDEKRPDYFPHVQPGNVWLLSHPRPRREWSMPQVIQSLGCLDLMDRGASMFPLYLYKAAARSPGAPTWARPRAYLDGLGFSPLPLGVGADECRKVHNTL